MARIFREIAEILELKGDNAFRTRAYVRAAEAVENLGGSLEALASQNRLTEIPGIGTDLSSKIQEIIATGSLKYYEALKKDFPSGLLELLRIPGLGPKTVKLIYEQLGICSIAELEKAARQGKLRKLEGVKEKTEANIIRGIDFLNAGRQKTLLYYALETFQEFITAMEKIKAVRKISAAGSLRRRKAEVGDIDILASSSRPAAVVDEFTRLDLAGEILSRGEQKASVLTRDKGIQVDLRVVAPRNFGAALLYFTGSQAFNIRLRQLAINKGYKINEYGLFSNQPSQEKLLAAATEREIFSLMSMDYIAPELREDQGEIEAALKGKLPQLPGLKDIKGDLHVHSNYSDGKNTIEEIARAAQDIGHQYIGISDHSRSLKIAGGLSIKEVYRKIEEVRRVSVKFKKVRLFCGAEVDILANGELDYPDSVLKELDFVIAAIHSGFTQSKEKLTHRIIAACQNRYVNIIAHPTGILRGVRGPYEIDLEEILKAARDHRVALEINSHPQRLDLNAVNARQAKEEGVKLVLNTDTHLSAQLEFMDLGLSVARRGWLEKKDLLNCLGAGELVRWLKK